MRVEEPLFVAMLSKRYLPLALLLPLICLLYANSLNNSFHFDDFHTITDNPAIRSLGNLPRIFTDTTAFSVLPANQTYRPVVTASLALDYALGRGYRPFWFHLSTLLWFLALVAVLFRFVLLLLDRVQPSPANRWLALGVAAWFGFHPAMAETVNYVIQRGDLYCTLGCLAALLLFARFPSWRRFGLYLVPFALAMLSKPPAAVFPLLLLLYVYFFEPATRRSAPRWRASVRAALPSTLVTVLLLALEHAMTPRTFAPSILSASNYRLTQPFVWLRYAVALFLPLHLNIDTDLQPFTTLNAAAIAGLLFVALLLALLVYAARKPRLYPIAYGLAWFVLTQLPTSLYTLSEVENDHRMFFSFPGLMLAVVWALYLLYQHLLTRAPATRTWLRPVALTAITLTLCGYAFGVYRRNQVWHDEATLWADDVAKSPHNGRGLMIFGLTRLNAGDLPGALALFTRALQYTPNYPTLEVNLGVVNAALAAQGQPALQRTAEQHFQRAITLAPEDDIPHAYYGRWLLTANRLPEATAQLQTAIALNPQRLMQRDLLLQAYTSAGNMAAAHALAQTTLALAPDDAAAHAALQSVPAHTTSPAAAALINASLVAYQAAQYQRSIDIAQKALQLDPQAAEAWNNIAAGNAALHRWATAVDAAQQAVALRPDFQLARNNLAWAQQQQRLAAAH